MVANLELASPKKSSVQRLSELTAMHQETGVSRFGVF
jgi:hypothetical protein